MTVMWQWGKNTKYQGEVATRWRREQLIFSRMLCHNRGRGSYTMDVLTAVQGVATGDEHAIRVRLEMTMWSMECYMRSL